jgi:MFS family permease
MATTGAGRRRYGPRQVSTVSGEGTPAPPVHAARPLLPDHPEDARGFRAVLRKGDFRLLWAAQAACQLGDKFLMFALIIVVYDLTKRSSTQSVLMIAYTLPSIVFSAPAGVYADRHDKRGLMLATNLLRGLLVLLIPLCQAIPDLRGQAWPLLIVTLLFSSVGQLFAPAEAASIPFLVAKPQIMAATSLFMTTVIITLVVGVPMATLSLRFFGDLAPFWIASALFGVATVSVYRMRASLRAASRAHVPKRHILVELREGAKILGSDAGLRIGLSLLTLSLVVVFTMFALGPAYMTTVLGRSPADTYLVLIPATVGLVAMALVLGQLSHRLSRAHALIWSMLAAGLLLVGIGLIPGALDRAGWNAALVPIAVCLSTTFGIALGGLLIPAFTVLQERTDEDSRGRIFGGIFTVINTSVAIPLLLAGGLADAFGVDRVVAGMGGILVVCGLVTAGWLGSRLRILDEHRVSH